MAGGDQTLRKQEYFVAGNQCELCLTTFQTLLNDQEEMIQFLNSNSVHAYLVIDEAHYMKQINGSWAKAVLNISEYAIYRCILTGTPLPKGYSDVFNYFDFLWPNRHIITDEKKAELQLLESEGDYPTASEILNDCISPLSYRVRKKDLGLAGQIFNVVSIPNFI